MKYLFVFSFACVFIFSQAVTANENVFQFNNFQQAAAIGLYNKFKKACETAKDEQSCKSANTHCRWNKQKCEFDSVDANKGAVKGAMAMFGAMGVAIWIPLAAIRAYEYLSGFDTRLIKIVAGVLVAVSANVIMYKLAGAI